MMYRDTLAEALYQCFTSPMVFPAPEHERHYRALCRLGYVEPAAQGHAAGFCIRPEGYAVAMARWGHEQR